MKTVNRLVLFTSALGLIISCSPKQGGSLEFDPPAVRRPSGLVADIGDGKAYLEWNPALEENLAGYHVYRRLGEAPFKRVTKKLLNSPAFIDSGLVNTQPVNYRVTTVLKSGIESKQSNEAGVTPQAVKAPQVVTGPAKVKVPGYDTVQIANAISVTFENGNKLVFDRGTAKVRDWIAPDGTHLLYPLLYGNPIDITEMNDWGEPVVQPATADRPAIPSPINFDYARPAGSPRQGTVWWVDHHVSENRITFEYRIPLSGPGMPLNPNTNNDFWVFATLWETWTPVERKISNGATYTGLARKIEIEMPSYYTYGYSICLNDGFGPNGSADKGITYQMRWGAEPPSVKETQWQKGKEIKGGASAVQIMPYLFSNFPEGTLIIAPRRYFYSTRFALTNYANEGKDGIWPNRYIDCDASGRRTSIETFEYLWSTGNTPALPQRWMDAAFHYRRNLADLYALKRNLTTMDYAWDFWGPGKAAIQGKSQEESLSVLEKWGTDIAAQAKAVGADIVGGAHELWISSPYTVSDDIRLNPDHPINRSIAKMIAEFTKQGIRWGYWMRPEYIKMPLTNILSDHFYTPYYGYVRQLFPSGTAIVEESGLKTVREHPEWLRLDRNGRHPMSSQYNWTPVTLTSKGWYEELLYKNLVMMKKLGCTSVFQDGGSTTLRGVDYSGGRAKAIMPYLWRFYQDMAELGMDLSGELPVGWGNNTLNNPNLDDMKQFWIMTHSVNRGNNQDWYTAEIRHKYHQLYQGVYINMRSSEDHAVVARFAHKFISDNGHPDRVFLEGLRWDQDSTMWVWNNVFWEYKNWHRVRYPDYSEVIGRQEIIK